MNDSHGTVNVDWMTFTDANFGIVSIKENCVFCAQNFFPVSYFLGKSDIGAELQPTGQIPTVIIVTV